MDHNISKTNKGTYGESIAEKYLKTKGHEIIEKNFRMKGGEIDLITLKNKVIYIYEVKFRLNTEYGYGDEAINSSKIKKIRNTFEIWLSHNKTKYDFDKIYFNAIVIDPDLKINEFEVL